MRVQANLSRSGVDVGLKPHLRQCLMIRAKKRVLVAAGAVCVLTSTALAVETSNFNLRTTRDLVALCSCQPDDPLYADAQQFCYGYMTGMAHLHRALIQANEIEPLVCPQHEVTRAALVRIFLDWTRNNLGAMDEPPAESVRRAAIAAWPCGSQ